MITPRASRLETRGLGHLGSDALDAEQEAAPAHLDHRRGAGGSVAQPRERAGAHLRSARDELLLLEHRERRERGGARGRVAEEGLGVERFAARRRPRVHHFGAPDARGDRHTRREPLADA